MQVIVLGSGIQWDITLGVRSNFFSGVEATLARLLAQWKNMTFGTQDSGISEMLE